jgi:hypothetical protein
LSLQICAASVLLYLGSGIGLGIIALCTRLFSKSAEAPLRRRDLPRLGLIVLFGGVLGPALLMAGLMSASGGASEIAFVAVFLASGKARAVSDEVVAATGGAGRTVFY